MHVYLTSATVVLVLVGAAASIGSAGEPGVTDDSIMLGSHQPLSGPAASYSPVARATEAYFNMINELGGVHGRRIIYKYEDDTYSPPRTVEVVRKLVERDNVFAIFNGLGTPTHTAVYYIATCSIGRSPTCTWGPAPRTWAFPPENDFKPYSTLFGWTHPYLTHGSILGTFAIENWPRKKVAMFYQNDDFGKDGADAFRRTVRGKLEIVSEDVYEVSAVTIESQILNARALGAEIVYLFSIPKFTGMYLKKCHEIGWKPQFLITGVSAFAPTWKLAGPDCDPVAGRIRCAASDGAITLKGGPTADETDNPKVARHYHIMAKYGRGLKVEDLTLAGQAVAELMEETLRRAGRNLTRESLTRAAESIKNWNEGLAPHVTMGPDDHAPLEDMKVVEVRNGKLARELTDWIQGSRPTK